jgi:alkanesulfonate monooxygenase SsuD/methylene tetrahydromethanopterin reductase-like flavin-dependent oxidoreductase (luciferase family)
MRLGLFMNFEHGCAEQDVETGQDAFERQMALGLKAEALGFEELWVSEHHFSPFTQSGSILALMAYLAGRTQKVRLGTAALLTPLHNPIRLAEDLATIDILSNGRLDLGLARGGPFPTQFSNFQIDSIEAQERAIEAGSFLLQLLERTEINFHGRWHECKALTTLPRLLQKPLPVFIASSQRETIEAAARSNHGLMAGHGASGARLVDLLQIYASASSGKIPDLIVLRNVCVADSDKEALAAAKPAIERFFGKMRQHSNPGSPYAPVSLDKSLETSIIGSPETCREKLAELSQTVPLGSIVLKLASPNFGMAEEIMQRFRSEVLPNQQIIAAASQNYTSVPSGQTVQL